MNLCLTGLLDSNTLQRVRMMLAAAEFKDGAGTAGWNARPVKRNLQTTHDAAAELVGQALTVHALFRSAVLPSRRSTPLFSRYLRGMSYGTHVDNALMGPTSSLRADLAVTVFLSDPTDYDGGELVLDTHSGTQAYKLEAGQALVYPATTLHRVSEITRGERLAAILWVQSFVRDAAQREILFDLDTVRRRLWDQAGAATTSEFELLSKTHANLLRAWAET